MSAAAEDKKSLRYKLGELLRDTTDHCLLLTATPHKGDPLNFSLFLRLLDEDAFADVRSIREAMDRRRAPFYLRRIKEAMVYFPEQQPDGSWAARKIFTKRIPKSVASSESFRNRRCHRHRDSLAGSCSGSSGAFARPSRSLHWRTAHHGPNDAPNRAAAVGWRRPVPAPRSASTISLNLKLACGPHFM
jgi:hypothetical protein